MTTPMWGLHNDTLTHELIDGGFVSIGWDELGDLTEIYNGRAGIKQALSVLRPDDKPRSIAGQAGVLYRFAHDVAVGDIVIAPYKPDSTINIGIIEGAYYYQSAAPHPPPSTIRAVGESWSTAGSV